MTSIHVGVIGAGIIGLSSAVCLKTQCPELEVTVIAESVSPNTTSDGAAGLWKPHLLGDKNAAKSLEWGETTFNYLHDIWKTSQAQDAGIVMNPAYLLCKKNYAEEPLWKDSVYGFRRMNTTELSYFNSNEYKSGFQFVTFNCQPTRMLPFLMRQFITLGGRFQIKKVYQLSELISEYDIVINCSGIGAKELVQDNSVYSVRGQVIKAWAPWVCETILIEDDSDRISYIIPNSDWLVLGGTQQKDNWSKEIDPEDTNHILNSTRQLIPSLKFSKPLKHWVGLRPCRESIRLERDTTQSNKLQVIYNYGHGGSGLTLFWGCALDTVQLVKEAVTDIHHSGKTRAIAKL